MKRVTPATLPTPPAPRDCPMCGGPAKYLGLFSGGDRYGFGCTDRGCRHSWLSKKVSAET